MTTAHKYSWAERVVLCLAVTLVWIITGSAMAAGKSPGLAGAPEAAGQGIRMRLPGGSQAPAGLPVVTGISPDSAPQGGVGEVVITGKNFDPEMGMLLGLSCATISNLKVESAERAVAQINVRPDQPEGKCEVTASFRAADRSLLASRVGTQEVQAQKAASVSFKIFNSPSSPLLVQLGQYTLFPEEEINLANSLVALDRNPPPTSQAQSQQMQNQMAAMNEIMQKVMRGEMTPDQAKAAAQKAQQGMQAQMTPEQKASVTRDKEIRDKQKEVQKQEKIGTLRLKQGSVSFLVGQNTLFTEPVSGLKEISVVPQPGREPFWSAFLMAFSDGKKYFFKTSAMVGLPGPPAADEVSRLKKRLGK